MVRPAVCLVLAAFFAVPAHAADWRYVTTSTTGADLYLDVESPRRVGDRIEVWRKWDHSQDNSVKYRESKELYYYKCSERTTALKSYVNYNADGSVFSSNSANEYLIEYQPVIPDTVGEAAFKAVCGS